MVFCTTKNGFLTFFDRRFGRFHVPGRKNKLEFCSDFLVSVGDLDSRNPAVVSVTRFQLGQPPLKGLKFAVACNIWHANIGRYGFKMLSNNIPCDFGEPHMAVTTLGF